MCLSDVYWLHNGEKELIFRQAAAVNTLDDAIVLEDILGRQKTVTGYSIHQVDLMNNYIYLKKDN